jgi:broad specificity phosphatase PhoE
MRLYLIRHAQPAPEVYDNRYPGPGLGELGRKQSEWIAAKVAPEGIATIFCSDFERTLQTASELERRSGIAPIYPAPELRERQAEEESHESLKNRVHKWMEDHLEFLKSFPCAIVAHGGSLNMILEFLDPFGDRFQSPYCDPYGVKTPIAGFWKIDLKFRKATLSQCPIQ